MRAIIFGNAMMKKTLVRAIRRRVHWKPLLSYWRASLMIEALALRAWIFMRWIWCFAWIEAPQILMRPPRKEDPRRVINSNGSGVVIFKEVVNGLMVAGLNFGWGLFGWGLDFCPFCKDVKLRMYRTIWTHDTCALSGIFEIQVLSGISFAGNYPNED